MDTITPTRRKVGRPPGSSRLNKEDARLCEMVADKLLANSTLSMRAAILQVINTQILPHLRNAALRRLQAKFNRDLELDAARERAAAWARAQKAPMDGLMSVLGFLGADANFEKLVAQMSPYLLTMKLAQDAVLREALPVMQAMKQLQDAGVFGMRPSKEVLDMIAGHRLPLLPPPYLSRK